MKHEECALQLIGIVVALRAMPELIESLSRDGAAGRVHICGECRAVIQRVFAAIE